VACLIAHNKTDENAMGPNATREDFRKLFTDDANGLYLLSFLLTGKHDMAERCFVAGLDECVEGNTAFQNWARSWARRIIIQNAIRMMMPRPGPSRPAPAALNLAGNLPGMRLQDAPFASILALEDFERLVYVLSVLEGYVDQNCALLLSASAQAVRNARERALKHIAEFEMGEAAPVNEFTSLGQCRSQR
jgi:DNA-directed RNA polymerase specialized sigma24 family protein